MASKNELLKKYKVEIETNILKAKEQVADFRKELDKGMSNGAIPAEFVSSVQAASDQLTELEKTVDSRLTAVEDRLKRIKTDELQAQMKDLKDTVVGTVETIAEEANALKAIFATSDKGQFTEFVNSMMKPLNDLNGTIREAIDAIGELSKKNIIINTNSRGVRAIKDLDAIIADSKKQIDDLAKRAKDIGGIDFKMFQKTLPDTKVMEEQDRIVRSLINAYERLQRVGENADLIFADSQFKGNISQLRGLREQFQRYFKGENPLAAQPVTVDLKFRIQKDANGKVAFNEGEIQQYADSIRDDLVHSIQEKLDDDPASKIKLKFKWDTEDADKEAAKIADPKNLSSSADDVLYRTLQIKLDVGAKDLENRVREAVDEVNKNIAGKDAFKIKVELMPIAPQGANLIDAAVDTSDEIAKSGYAVRGGQVTLKDSGDLAKDDTLQEIKSILLNHLGDESPKKPSETRADVEASKPVDKIKDWKATFDRIDVAREEQIKAIVAFKEINHVLNEDILNQARASEKAVQQLQEQEYIRSSILKDAKMAIRGGNYANIVNSLLYTESLKGKSGIEYSTYGKDDLGQYVPKVQWQKMLDKIVKSANPGEQFEALFKKIENRASGRINSALQTAEANGLMLKLNPKTKVWYDAALGKTNRDSQHGAAHIKNQFNDYMAPYRMRAHVDDVYLQQLEERKSLMLDLQNTKMDPGERSAKIERLKQLTPGVVNSEYFDNLISERESLTNELNAEDAKGNKLLPKNQRRYREVVNRLSEIAEETKFITTAKEDFDKYIAEELTELAPGRTVIDTKIEDAREALKRSKKAAAQAAAIYDSESRVQSPELQYGSGLTTKQFGALFKKSYAAYVKRNGLSQGVLEHFGQSTAKLMQYLETDEQYIEDQQRRKKLATRVAQLRSVAGTNGAGLADIEWSAISRWGKEIREIDARAAVREKYNEDGTLTKRGVQEKLKEMQAEAEKSYKLPVNTSIVDEDLKIELADLYAKTKGFAAEEFLKLTEKEFNDGVKTLQKADSKIRGGKEAGVRSAAQAEEASLLRTLQIDLAEVTAQSMDQKRSLKQRRGDIRSKNKLKKTVEYLTGAEEFIDQYDPGKIITDQRLAKAGLDNNKVIKNLLSPARDSEDILASFDASMDKYNAANVALAEARSDLAATEKKQRVVLANRYRNENAEEYKNIKTAGERKGFTAKSDKYVERELKTDSVMVSARNAVAAAEAALDSAKNGINVWAKENYDAFAGKTGKKSLANLSFEDVVADSGKNIREALKADVAKAPAQKGVKEVYEGFVDEANNAINDTIRKLTEQALKSSPSENRLNRLTEKAGAYNVLTPAAEKALEKRTQNFWEKALSADPYGEALDVITQRGNKRTLRFGKELFGVASVNKLSGQYLEMPTSVTRAVPKGYEKDIRIGGEKLFFKGFRKYGYNEILRWMSDRVGSKESTDIRRQKSLMEDLDIRSLYEDLARINKIVAEATDLGIQKKKPEDNIAINAMGRDARNYFDKVLEPLGYDSSTSKMLGDIQKDITDKLEEREAEIIKKYGEDGETLVEQYRLLYSAQGQLDEIKSFEPKLLEKLSVKVTSGNRADINDLYKQLLIETSKSEARQDQGMIDGLKALIADIEAGKYDDKYVEVPKFLYERQQNILEKQRAQKTGWDPILQRTYASMDEIAQRRANGPAENLADVGREAKETWIKSTEQQVSEKAESVRLDAEQIANNEELIRQEHEKLAILEAEVDAARNTMYAATVSKAASVDDIVRARNNIDKTSSGSEDFIRKLEEAENGLSKSEAVIQEKINTLEEKRREYVNVTTRVDNIARLSAKVFETSADGTINARRNDEEIIEEIERNANKERQIAEARDKAKKEVQGRQSGKLKKAIEKSFVSAEERQDSAAKEIARTAEMLIPDAYKKQNTRQGAELMTSNLRKALEQAESRLQEMEDARAEELSSIESIELKPAIFGKVKRKTYLREDSSREMRDLVNEVRRKELRDAFSKQEAEQAAKLDSLEKTYGTGVLTMVRDEALRAIEEDKEAFFLRAMSDANFVRDYYDGLRVIPALQDRKDVLNSKYDFNEVAQSYITGYDEGALVDTVSQNVARLNEFKALLSEYDAANEKLEESQKNYNDTYKEVIEQQGRSIFETDESTGEMRMNPDLDKAKKEIEKNQKASEGVLGRVQDALKKISGMENLKAEDAVKGLRKYVLSELESGVTESKNAFAKSSMLYALASGKSPYTKSASFDLAKEISAATGTPSINDAIRDYNQKEAERAAQAAFVSNIDRIYDVKQKDVRNKNAIKEKFGEEAQNLAYAIDDTIAVIPYLESVLRNNTSTLEQKKKNAGEAAEKLKDSFTELFEGVSFDEIIKQIQAGTFDPSELQKKFGKEMPDAQATLVENLMKIQDTVIDASNEVSMNTEDLEYWKKKLAERQKSAVDDYGLTLDKERGRVFASRYYKDQARKAGIKPLDVETKGRADSIIQRLADDEYRAIQETRRASANELRKLRGERQKQVNDLSAQENKRRAEDQKYLDELRLKAFSGTAEPARNQKAYSSNTQRLLDAAYYGGMDQAQADATKALREYVGYLKRFEKVRPDQEYKLHQLQQDAINTGLSINKSGYAYLEGFSKSDWLNNPLAYKQNSYTLAALNAEGANIDKFVEALDSGYALEATQQRVLGAILSLKKDGVAINSNGGEPRGSGRPPEISDLSNRLYSKGFKSIDEFDDEAKEITRKAVLAGYTINRDKKKDGAFYVGRQMSEKYINDYTKQAIEQFGIDVSGTFAEVAKSAKAAAKEAEETFTPKKGKKWTAEYFDKILPGMAELDDSFKEFQDNLLSDWKSGKKTKSELELTAASALKEWLGKLSTSEDIDDWTTLGNIEVIAKKKPEEIIASLGSAIDAVNAKRASSTDVQLLDKASAKSAAGEIIKKSLGDTFDDIFSFLGDYAEDAEKQFLKSHFDTNWKKGQKIPENELEDSLKIGMYDFLKRTMSDIDQAANKENVEDWVAEAGQWKDEIGSLLSSLAPSIEGLRQSLEDSAKQRAEATKAEKATKATKATKETKEAVEKKPQAKAEEPPQPKTPEVKPSKSVTKPVGETLPITLPEAGYWESTGLAKDSTLQLTKNAILELAEGKADKEEEAVGITSELIKAQQGAGKFFTENDVKNNSDVRSIFGRILDLERKTEKNKVTGYEIRGEKSRGFISIDGKILRSGVTRLSDLTDLKEAEASERGLLRDRKRLQLEAAKARLVKADETLAASYDKQVGDVEADLAAVQKRIKDLGGQINPIGASAKNAEEKRRLDRNYEYEVERYKTQAGNKENAAQESKIRADHQKERDLMTEINDAQIKRLKAGENEAAAINTRIKSRETELEQVQTQLDLEGRLAEEEEKTAEHRIKLRQKLNETSAETTGKKLDKAAEKQAREEEAAAKQAEKKRAREEESAAKKAEGEAKREAAKQKTEQDQYDNKVAYNQADTAVKEFTRDMREAITVGRDLNQVINDTETGRDKVIADIEANTGITRKQKEDLKHRVDEAVLDSQSRERQALRDEHNKKAASYYGELANNGAKYYSTLERVLGGNALKEDEAWVIQFAEDWKLASEMVELYGLRKKDAAGELVEPEDIVRLDELEGRLKEVGEAADKLLVDAEGSSASKALVDSVWKKFYTSGTENVDTGVVASDALREYLGAKKQEVGNQIEELQKITAEGSKYYAEFKGRAQELINDLTRHQENLNIETFRAGGGNEAITSNLALQKRYSGIMSGRANIDNKQSNLATVTSILKKATDTRQTYLGMPTELLNSYDALISTLKDYADQLEKTPEKVSAAAVRGLVADLNTLDTKLAESGRKTAGVFGVVTNRLTDMNAKFIAQYFSIQDWIRYLRTAITTVIELDTALTELRKVSSETDARLSQSMKTSAQTATSLGSTISEVVNATADWARLGYGIDQAEELARISILYKNVGDNIDIDTASSSLISTLKGYQLEADMAESVVDKFNEIGNNFAINSAEIGEALKRSAASFNASGTSLDKSIALVTAANTVAQNAESVGTTFKTLSARIRGAKTELEELGVEEGEFTTTTSKLRDKVKALTGFDIVKEDGKTYKDIYDILIGIGKEWNNLTDLQRASLGEDLAGKRNANILYAVLQDTDLLEQVYRKSLESAGSAMREQENFQRSIQYSINQLKANGQSLAQDFMSTNLVKGTTSFLASVVGYLDQIIAKTGGLTPVIGALMGSSSIKAAGGLQGIWNGARQKNLFKMTYETPIRSTVLNQQYRDENGEVQVAREIGTVIGKETKKIGFLETTGGKLLANLGVTALITAATGFISSYYTALEKGREATQQSAREIQEAQATVNASLGDIEGLQDTMRSATATEDEKIKAKEKLTKIQEDLVAAYGKEADAIDVVQGKLDGNLASIDAQIERVQELAVEQYKQWMREQHEGGWFGIGAQSNAEYGKTAFDQMTAQTDEFVQTINHMALPKELIDSIDAINGVNVTKGINWFGQAQFGNIELGAVNVRERKQILNSIIDTISDYKSSNNLGDEDLRKINDLENSLAKIVNNLDINVFGKYEDSALSYAYGLVAGSDKDLGAYGKLNDLADSASELDLAIKEGKDATEQYEKFISAKKTVEDLMPEIESEQIGNALQYLVDHIAERFVGNTEFVKYDNGTRQEANNVLQRYSQRTAFENMKGKYSESQVKEMLDYSEGDALTFKAPKEDISLIQKLAGYFRKAGGEVDDLTKGLKDMGFYLSEAVDEAETLSGISIVDSLTDATSGLDKISDVLADLQDNNGKFDFTKIGTESFAKAFEGIEQIEGGTAALEEFQKAVLASKGAMGDDVQNAANNLADALIRLKLESANVTAEDQELIAAMLETMNVTNAEAYAAQYCAEKKAELAYDEIEAANATEESEVAALQNAVALSEEEGAANLDAYAFYELMLKKLEAAIQYGDSATIAALAAEAEVALGTANAFIVLANAKAAAMGTATSAEEGMYGFDPETGEARGVRYGIREENRANAFKNSKAQGQVWEKSSKQNISWAIEAARAKMADAGGGAVKPEIGGTPGGGSGGGGGGSGDKDKKDEKKEIDWMERMVTLLQKQHDLLKENAADEYQTYEKRIEATKELIKQDENLLNVYQKQSREYGVAYEKAYDEVRKLAENGQLKDLWDNDIYGLGASYEEIKKVNDEINATFEKYGKRNLDYNNRPYIKNDDGSWTTILTETAGFKAGEKEFSVVITPILENGDEIDLDAYIDQIQAGLDEKAANGEEISLDTLISLDPNNLIAVAAEGGMDVNGAAFEQMEAELQGLKDKATELRDANIDGVKSLRDAVENGALDISQFSQEVQEAIQNLMDKYDKVQESREKEKQTIKEIKDHQQEMYEMELNMIKERQKAIENERDIMQHSIDMRETTGSEIIKESDYEELIDNADELADNYREQLAVLEEQKGTLEEGSAAWYNVVSQIYECEGALRDVEKQQAEWNEQIKQLPIRRIERYIQMLENIKKDITNFNAEMGTLGINPNQQSYTDLFVLDVEALGKYQDELDKLRENLKTYTYGTDKFEETANAIQACEDNVSQLIQDMHEYNTAILNIPIDKINELVEKLEQIKSALEEVQSDNDLAINAAVTLLSEQIDDYNKQIDDINKDYEDRIKLLQEESDVLEDQTEDLQDQADLIRDKIEALEEERDANKEQIALEKARIALEKARGQRTNKVLKEGSWTWQADQQALQNAAEQVREAEYAKKIADLNKEIKDIDKQIEDIDDQRDDIADEIERLEKERDKTIEPLQDQVDTWTEYQDKWSTLESKRENQLTYDKATAIFGDKNWQEKVLSGKDDDLWNKMDQSYNKYLRMIDAYNEQIKDYQQTTQIMSTYISEYNKGNLTAAEVTSKMNKLIQNTAGGYDSMENLTDTLSAFNEMNADSALFNSTVAVNGLYKDFGSYMQIVADQNATLDKYTQTWDQIHESVQAQLAELKRLADIEAQKLAERQSRSRGSGGGGSDRNEITQTGIYAVADRNGALGVIDHGKFTAVSGREDDVNHDIIDRFTYHTGVEKGVVGGSDDEKAKMISALATGTFKRDEVPSLLQEGELVLTKNQQANLLKNLVPLDESDMLSQYTLGPDVLNLNAFRAKRLKGGIAAGNGIQMQQNFNFGDIHVMEAQNVTDIARGIMNGGLSQALTQQLYKR